MGGKTYDVYGMGNTLVDMEFEVEEAILEEFSLEKGMMSLVDEETQRRITGRLGRAPKAQACGGSVANSMGALAHLGGRGHYCGRAGEDEAGDFYHRNLLSLGLANNLGPPRPVGVTGRCLVLITPDGERTMCTFLGINSSFGPEDLDLEALAQARYLYIEGYLMDCDGATRAAIEAMELARARGVAVALTFSDPSVVAHHGRNLSRVLERGVDILFLQRTGGPGFFRGPVIRGGPGGPEGPHLQGRRHPGARGGPGLGQGERGGLPSPHPTGKAHQHQWGRGRLCRGLPLRDNGRIGSRAGHGSGLLGGHGRGGAVWPKAHEGEATPDQGPVGGPSMRPTIKSLLENPPLGEMTSIGGWVKSVRRSKRFSFLVLSDGSTPKALQLIVDATVANYGEVQALTSGTAIWAQGPLVASRGQGQEVEMQVASLEILGPCGEDYPIQKKALSLEFLREKAHLRVRTDLFGAVFRLRHHLSLATHSFFHERDFFYLHSPIITAVDAEGAGEQFTVTALDLENLPREEGLRGDYFGGPKSLCVTGQLEAECVAQGLGRVYTFGPTFRAENSNTPRHLAEFWMVEPEASFFDLEDIVALGLTFLRHLVAQALEACPGEMALLAARPEAPPNHLKALEDLAQGEGKSITYGEALGVLKASGQPFEFAPEWGHPLQTEHERYLAEEYAQGPLAVVDYPKEIKAFYMRQNDDGKTVRAMDILVPGVGELMGGSQREERLERIEARMDELAMEKAPLWWYLDLRRYGTVPHSGFGLGLERALMFVTGLKNIRDVIAFPRTPRHCDF